MPEATLVIIFVTSFVVGLSGALMPGPLLALNLSEAARRGFWAGPILVLGHGVVELVVVVALTRGLSELLERGIVAGVIGLLGGLFLLWMGFGILGRARREMVPLTASPHHGGRSGTLVLLGALVSISNPYWVLWWATVGASYVIWSLEEGTIGVSSFFAGHILSDLSWYSLVSLVIARGRKLMSDAVYRGLLLVCGLALFILGGYFIISGGRFLSGG